MSAISSLGGWRFGRVKTIYDMGIVASAVVVSLAVMGQSLGIREGTVAAALNAGSTSHFFIHKISGFLEVRMQGYSSAGNAGDVCP